MFSTAQFVQPYISVALRKKVSAISQHLATLARLDSKRLLCMVVTPIWNVQIFKILILNNKKKTLRLQYLRLDPGELEKQLEVVEVLWWSSPTRQTNRLGKRQDRQRLGWGLTYGRERGGPFLKAAKKLKQMGLQYDSSTLRRINQRGSRNVLNLCVITFECSHGIK